MMKRVAKFVPSSAQQRVLESQKDILDLSLRLMQPPAEGSSCNVSLQGISATSIFLRQRQIHVAAGTR
jgi:hypothetical protein